MKIEQSITGKQYRFYGDDNKYLGSVRVEIRGPRCILDSLDSKHFYKNFDMIWQFINATSGTHIWNCHVTEKHYLAIIRLIGHKYKAEVLAREMNAGREMLYVEVIKK